MELLTAVGSGSAGDKNFGAFNLLSPGYIFFTSRSKEEILGYLRNARAEIEPHRESDSRMKLEFDKEGSLVERVGTSTSTNHNITLTEFNRECLLGIQVFDMRLNKPVTYSIMLTKYLLEYIAKKGL